MSAGYGLRQLKVWSDCFGARAAAKERNRALAVRCFRLWVSTNRRPRIRRDISQSVAPVCALQELRVGPQVRQYVDSVSQDQIGVLRLVCLWERHWNRKREMLWVGRIASRVCPLRRAIAQRAMNHLELLEYRGPEETLDVVWCGARAPCLTDSWRSMFLLQPAVPHTPANIGGG